MARKRRKRKGRRSAGSGSAADAAVVEEGKPVEQTEEKPKQGPRLKKWLQRGVLAILGPLLFFGICEFSLRLFGFGVPTQFLLTKTINEVSCWTPNTHFGKRFFGADYARQPAPFTTPQNKDSDVIRILVFGESAALGDPQPDFGLSRILRTLLSAKFPDTKFEVVNTAMTGINSHAIREIADDCQAADGDIWVIYMGNNEVVGPFGAGTVFGPQAPSETVIRSNLAVKSSRFGQLLDRLAVMINPPPASRQEWGGMLAFVDNQLRSDDPRMRRTYEHFASNLRHLLDSAESAGAAVVLSTVAVNLRDCAPFASLHKPDLSSDQLEHWQEAFDTGLAEQAKQDFEAALAGFETAKEIDATYADLSFALARNFSAMGDVEEAARYYRLARDQDALRFRCDTKLNDTISEIAAEYSDRGLRLADAEQALADAAGETQAPGREFFYEHVHLTFLGNYLLAKCIADEVIPLLPDSLRAAEAEDWLTVEQCVHELAWSAWTQASAINDMIARLADAPFSGQANHQEQLAALMQEARILTPRIEEVVRRVDEVYAVPLAANPDDSLLYAQRAKLRLQGGNLEGALEDAERAVKLLPISVSHQLLLGSVQAACKKFNEAAATFASVTTLDKKNADALLGLARVDRSRDNREAAIAAYRRAIELSPHYGTAYLELGLLLEEVGKTKEALQNFRIATENRVLRVPDLMALTSVCLNQQWMDEAASSCLQAVSLRPHDFGLRMQAGQILVKADHSEGAMAQFFAAVQLSPNSGEAHFLLAKELGRKQQYEEAIAHFREAARLLPKVAAPQINLGITLKAAGRPPDALAAFRAALEIEPGNAVAQKYIAALTNSDSP